MGLSYLVPHEPHDWCDGSPAKGIALRGAKGVGKGVEDAWIVWWLLLCFPYPNIAAMSVSADNLRDNLWKELAVWYGRASILQKTFEIRGERIVLRGAERDLEDRWYCSARSFPRAPNKDQQAAAVQGLHADHVAVIIDEGGSVPPGILHAAEGIHANPVHSLVVVSGNCDSIDGALYDASVKRGHRYHTVRVTGDPDDPQCSKRIDKEHNRQLIADYGRGDPVVMINVLAEFPAHGVDKILSPEEVTTAEKRAASSTRILQESVILGLDIARHGMDSSVLAKRQGPAGFILRQWHTPDLMTLADQVATVLNEEKPDALIVGATGIGWGVVDRLRQLGWGDMLIAVDEGTNALDQRFHNRRTEMWCNLAAWVKREGSLPKPADAELRADLLAPGKRQRFLHGRTAELLDPLDVIKESLGRSPDKGTALALTFAAPVASRGIREARSSRHVQPAKFDPWDAMRGGG